MENSQNQLRGYPDNPLINDRLFFEKIFSPCKSHPYIFWLCLFLLYITISIFLFAQENRAIKLLYSVIIFQYLIPSFTVFLVPCGMKLGVKVICSWALDLEYFIQSPEQKIKTWFRNESAVFSGTKGMFFCGLFVSFLAIITLWPIQDFSFLNRFTFLVSSLIKLLAALIILSAGFFGGVALCNLFYVVRIIWRLGSFNIKVHCHEFGVISTGKALLKCFIIASVIWFFYVSSVVFGYNANLTPLIILSAPSIGVIIISFVICQIPIHNRMVEYKKRELTKIEKSLDILAPQSPENLTEERRNQINFFEKKRSEILALPEWPFGWKSLLGTSFSGVFSGLPMIIKLSDEALNLLQTRVL